MNESDEFQVDADTLLVFVDDTGHEAFKGVQHYYGLGGCIIRGGADYAWLKKKWLEVRARINRSPDIPLHAADMALKPENFAALKEFFLDRSFARIGTASTKACSYPVEMHTALPVMATVQEFIDWFASLVPCDRVAVVVESSKRADPIFKKHFGELRSESVRQVKSTSYWFMSKSAGEPGLEVADFIVSAVGSQTKRLAAKQNGHAKDFADVFCQLPAIACRYKFIEEVDGEKELGHVVVRGIQLMADSAR
jgi:hypothetical protein